MLKSGCRIQELEREVHVWCVELSAPAAVVQRTSSLLPLSEKERAAGFRFSHLSEAFVLSHGVLRILLSRYVRTLPERIRFAYGKHGKPALAETALPIQFNMAHSGKLAVYAFALDCDVGIDVELLRPVPDALQLAQQFFCWAEYEDLAKVEPAHLSKVFLNCWVRKEAYIKALGCGLVAPLNSFRVWPCLEDASTGQPDARAWAMHDFCPAPGYVGGVAFKDHQRLPRFYPLSRADEVLGSLTGNAASVV